MKVDLHIHTNASDGNLALLQILTLAKRGDIKEIAITDHSILLGAKGLRDLESDFGIKIVQGIESEVDVKGMHLLGYGIKDSELVQKFLDQHEEYNLSQNMKTLKALSEAGFIIDEKIIKDFVNGKSFSYRDIVKYLVYKKYVSDARAVYKNYIGKGAFAYFPSYIPTAKEFIKLIHESGGFVSLAHPNTISNGNELCINLSNLKNDGLDAIETINIKAGVDSDTIRILQKRFHLIETVGSDFHDSESDTLGVEADEEIVNEFNELLIQ